MTRGELEQDSEFLGLIIMQVFLVSSFHLKNIQNLLKKETFGAIAELHKVGEKKQKITLV